MSKLHALLNLNGSKSESSPTSHSSLCEVLLEQTRTQSAKEPDTLQYKHGLKILNPGSQKVEEAGMVRNKVTTGVKFKDSSKHQKQNNSTSKCINGNIRSDEQTVRKTSNCNDISNSIGGVYFTSSIHETSYISSEKSSDKIESKSRLLRQKMQEPPQGLLVKVTT